MSEGPAMTAEERFEHMVSMAMQAWDACHVVPSGPTVGAMVSRWMYDMDRKSFEEAVRERLAQSAMVYELEIGAAERSAPMPEGW